MADVLDIPEAVVLVTDWTEAARLLEQSVRAGNQDSQAAYLLAMSYKHLGRTADARQVLAKIANPDANVLLQRGVLAFHDKDFAQAAEEFTRSWEKFAESWPAAYNLLLTRLCLGQANECAELIPRVLHLAPSPGDQRLLTLLRVLMLAAAPGAAPSTEGLEAPMLFGGMTGDEEARLLDLLAGLNQFDVTFSLLAKLVALRPRSDQAHAAYFGVALVQAKSHLDRCEWSEADDLLGGLRRRTEAGAARLDGFYQLVMYQMIGVSANMLQDFDRGLQAFRTAQEIYHREVQHTGTQERMQRFFNGHGVPLAAWLEQNLALTYELQNRLDKAEPHWLRYLDALEQNFSRSQPADYLPSLAFECLTRLAEQFSKVERWTSALGCLQRAHRIRPNDYDTLERLFHLFTQLKRSEDARKILRRLREVRPNDPQVELFDLEVRELRSVEEVERLLGDLRRILQKYPGDLRVEERGTAALQNLVPALERCADQHTAQVNKVVDQMRRLPSYQINWPVVRDIMRDLEDQFVYLRRVAQKCLAQITHDDLRRDLNRLIAHCDRKIDQCHTLGS
ncbi:MAG: tetratricopeptide repeat protein [Gemmataceae bacterium]|nr:tetratricopeptide repeat protein [Gemmataceae bacterium]